MIYILNSNLNDQKKISRALCEIYGIGDQLSKQICDDLGISTDLKVNDLSPSHIDLLSQTIPQTYLIGAELQGETRKSKERLVLVSSYRGIRHSQGLPSRGQRTHGNAQTARKGRFNLSKTVNKKRSPRG
ncbi:Ribosomal protein S13 (mitochondrion) [Coccomyxa sp. Obi]|nr:Ribosomal protein S13 [Coccomyxa sp. Obi]